MTPTATEPEVFAARVRVPSTVLMAPGRSWERARCHFLPTGEGEAKLVIARDAKIGVTRRPTMSSSTPSPARCCC